MRGDSKDPHHVRGRVGNVASDSARGSKRFGSSSCCFFLMEPVVDAHVIRFQFLLEHVNSRER